MKTLIRTFSAGSVATINPDGTPSVSPKATFLVLDDRTIAFGHIRSPRTLDNLRKNRAVEICFTDIVHRRALRVTGRAMIVPKAEAEASLLAAFESRWKIYVPHMSAFVVVEISRIEEIISPAYDLGFIEAELRTANLAALNALQRPGS